MPIPFLADVLTRGPSAFPYLSTPLKCLPWIALIGGLKLYFSGARNRSERLLHGKVIMITGGLSGIGASLAQSLALRGAQVILLTQHPPSDPFVAEFIEDLRASTSNELIYAEQVDLGSLHSIRLFATRWIDNTPPRRLDMVMLCAATMKPWFSLPAITHDGLEPCWGINYLANFHLLSLLSPAIRAQPPDRDVRIVIATCAGYIGGDLRSMIDEKAAFPKGREYETSKLALMIFGFAFQKHLNTNTRPDGKPNNVRIVMVDPGYTRTPGMRRWLSMGSLLGLLVYLVTWPLWWLLLKSPEMGSQSFLRGAMEADLGRGAGGKLLKNCQEIKIQRPEAVDEAVAKQLWSFSEKQIMALEKDAAMRRVAKKKHEDYHDSVIRSSEIGETTSKASSGIVPRKGRKV